MFSRFNAICTVCVRREDRDWSDAVRAAPEDDAPTGAGEAAGGQVRAVVGEDGLLARLKLDPRAMRLASHDLAEHIVAAVRAAQQDRLARTPEPGPPQDDLATEELIRRVNDLEAQAAGDFARLTSSLDEMLRRLDDPPGGAAPRKGEPW
ncbi:YbaB/EbfC family DNA-binding protein [Nonomuraea mesophila]|uniref:YbaB/EbfC family DNA-binding protein n=1 Tax=Nonomuraea mesophila TaxID=2530382 RepID=A0A4R5E2W6_9ACTN|nr:YbaB/EbfC family DNA-binding protein [Nonomuraea mesophila]